MQETKAIKEGGKFSRRELLSAAAAAGGMMAAPGCSRSGPSGATGTGPIDPVVVALDNHAVVETTAGKVWGFTRNGIHTFLGIPYGAPTAGKARFQRAAKPEPWAGVRTTMHYGKVCPQGPRAGWNNDVEAFLMQWDDGQPGEDCLRVNVWTPGLDNRKRPVMFWIHGGGYQAGSGQELPAYHGENLARRGDVVVVSVNHRLGVFGFLNLAEYGRQYEESANVGMLDLVLALEWVRDNIANFGGDAGNVMIFGQSGGGGKVNTLMTMPEARGLFHKAAVQSGSLLMAARPEESAKFAATVLSILGIGKSQIARLHEVPVEALLRAQVEAQQKLATPQPGGLPRPLIMPTVDGKVLPSVPFDPVAPEISAGIPLLVGTVLNEFNPAMSNPQAEDMSEEELMKFAGEVFKGKAGAVVEACRKVYPGIKPVEVRSILSAISFFRQGAIKQAERHTALGKAPVYLYQFNWKTPVMGGRPRAFHCQELPFVFYNIERCANSTGGGAEPRALAAKISDAWINFARTGDPNHSGLPRWPKFDPATAPVMIFDKDCVVKPDPERELRALIEEASKA